MKKNKQLMSETTKTNIPNFEIDEEKYRTLYRRQIFRLLLTYVLPLFLLILFFQIEYNKIHKESTILHLKSTAETQAQTLDLFLRERVVNLLNLIDDPKFDEHILKNNINVFLDKLKKDSEAFIDLGYFDSSGIQNLYAGPFPNLRNINYSNEQWFKTLISNPQRYVITDIYMGFRNLPHFTIAVKKSYNGRISILRATLDPTKIYNFLLSATIFRDVLITLVNKEGKFQLTNPRLGNVLERSPFLPPQEPKVGFSEIVINRKTFEFGYCWLTQTEWCVIASSEKQNFFFGSSFQQTTIIISFLTILFLFIVILVRAKKIVEFEKEKELAEMEKKLARLQLEHASKLAAVGELAAGIAHEINNPLAIIASEAGLIKDLINPEFKQNISLSDLTPHLDNIQQSAFRARDITRKLMTFVRRDDLKLDSYDVNQIINELLEGFVEHELFVSNIILEKRLQPNLPKVWIDANSFRQVILNLLNNAKDAINGPGKITISTYQDGDHVKISVKDTGCGISQEQMDKIFLPFYTTKPVGKGTGLGLSVSYNIIKSFGGTIQVESIVGKGSNFTIVLPIQK